MADYNQNRFAPRKKTALDNIGFGISVPVEGEQGKYSRLLWTMRGNNLTIRVYTGVSADQGNNYGSITADLEGVQFFAFLEMVKEAVASSGEYKNRIECAKFIFPQGKRSDKPVTISTVYVGRSAEGLIWVSIIDNLKKERPRIQFPFSGGRWHHFKHGDGTDYTRAEVSQLTAKAFCTMLTQIGSHLMVLDYKEPEKKNKQGSQAQNQSPSYSNSSVENTISDDDIPF